jgi:hypothetical protein
MKKSNGKVKGNVSNWQIKELSKKFILIIKPEILLEHEGKLSCMNPNERIKAVNSIFKQLLDEISADMLIDADSASDIKFLLCDYLHRNDDSDKYYGKYLSDIDCDNDQYIEEF